MMLWLAPFECLDIVLFMVVQVHPSRGLGDTPTTDDRIGATNFAGQPPSTGGDKKRSNVLTNNTAVIGPRSYVLSNCDPDIRPYLHYHQYSEQAPDGGSHEDSVANSDGGPHASTDSRSDEISHGESDQRSDWATVPNADGQKIE
eukprot:gene28683-37002_t